VPLREAGPGPRPWCRRLPRLVPRRPDGRLGSPADTLVRLLDVVTGKERHAFAGHSGGIVSLTFSADGKTLVSGSDDTTLLVWDGIRHKISFRAL
jgi:WD40 repeat protein